MWSRFLGSSTRCSALALALLAQSGCVVQEPIGPPTVVVTVAPWPAGVDALAALSAAFASDAAAGRVRGFEVELGGADPWTAGAMLMAQSSADALVDRRVPGSLETVAERLSREEFECGAFLSGELFDEKQGLLQGCLMLDETWLREAADADPGPLGAAAAGAQYVTLRVRRPLEDTPFAWVHLDLSEAALARGLEPIGDARTALEAALASIAAGVAGDPASVVALVSLEPSSDATTATAALRGRGELPSTTIDAAGFGDRLRLVMAASEAAEEAQ